MGGARRTAHHAPGNSGHTSAQAGRRPGARGQNGRCRAGWGQEQQKQRGDGAVKINLAAERAAARGVRSVSSNRQCATDVFLQSSLRSLQHEWWMRCTWAGISGRAGDRMLAAGRFARARVVV